MTSSKDKRLWHHYRVNERINDRGVRIDTELVQQAITCDLLLSDAMTTKAYELTGLENPNSVSQLKTWLDERGISMDTLGKKNVTEMIGELDKNGVDAEAMDMLKLRLQMAKSSVKKYQAAERCVCPDGRARGLFQFYGASRTGRYSGRNIQLQNLPQNHISTLDEARTLVKMGCFDMVESIYGNTPDVLSQLIRTMLIPKEGCEFIVADFSAIEARVLAWEAGEQWVLDAFQNGEDLYCATASHMLKQDLLIPLKDGDIDAANAASLTGKLLQMSNGAVYDENGKARILHDHKLEALEDLIEAANGQSVLVAYWFKHDRERIINHLTKLKIPVRDIKTSDDIKDWNAGKIPVALIHPASAGHGLNIQQGGQMVEFRASAAVPRLYRIKFGRDIYKDLRSLEKSVGDNDEESSSLDLFSLEMFENIAYIMAKHAHPDQVPDTPDEWLENFNTFSIYQILPQLIELWGLNVQTEVEARKNLAKVSG